MVNTIVTGSGDSKRFNWEGEVNKSSNGWIDEAWIRAFHPVVPHLLMLFLEKLVSSFNFDLRDNWPQSIPKPNNTDDSEHEENEKWDIWRLNRNWDAAKLEEANARTPELAVYSLRKRPSSSAHTKALAWVNRYVSPYPERLVNIFLRAFSCQSNSKCSPSTLHCKQRGWIAQNMAWSTHPCYCVTYCFVAELAHEECRRSLGHDWHL